MTNTDKLCALVENAGHAIGCAYADHIRGGMARTKLRSPDTREAYRDQLRTTAPACNCWKAEALELVKLIRKGQL